MPLTIFCHLFSKTMVKYSMMGSQSHLGLTFQWPWCMFLHSTLVLQRSSPRPSSSAHSPAPCAPLFFFQGGQHTWTLPVMPHPFWLPQAPAGLNHPLKRFSFAPSPAEGNCLLGYLRSAKSIPASLGKSPGCEFFMLKMKNWGHSSYIYIFREKIG